MHIWYRRFRNRTTGHRLRRLFQFYGREALRLFLQHPLTTARVVLRDTLKSVQLNVLGTYRRFSRVYKPEDPKLQALHEEQDRRDLRLRVGCSMLILPVAFGGWMFGRKKLPTGANIVFTLSIVYFPLIAGIGAGGGHRYTMPNLAFYSVYWAMAVSWVVSYLWTRWASRTRFRMRPART